MNVNGREMKEMMISPILKDSWPDMLLSGATVKTVQTFKLLGVNVSNNLKWKEHIDDAASKAASYLYFLTQLK